MKEESSSGPHSRETHCGYFNFRLTLTYVKFVNDNGRRILIRAMRLATSWRTRTHSFGLYAMDKATQDDREKFIRSVENKLARI